MIQASTYNKSRDANNLKVFGFGSGFKKYEFLLTIFKNLSEFKRLRLRLTKIFFSQNVLVKNRFLKFLFSL